MQQVETKQQICHNGSTHGKEIQYNGSLWPKVPPTITDELMDTLEDGALHRFDGETLNCTVFAQDHFSRFTRVVLPHGTNLTPMFMPVGTNATVKGLTPEQLEQTGSQMILANTYHCSLNPGADSIADHGGLHTFEKYNKCMLTDSGGFQLVSLSSLAIVTEKGVKFKSTHSDAVLTLTPEDAVDLQEKLGADIMMQLDDVVHVLEESRDRVKEAAERSIRWLDRQIAAKQRKDTILYAIVHGALDDEIRRWSAREIAKRPLEGWAIGGLSGGEEKSDFCRMVRISCEELPPDRPRYVMGVGYPEDILACVLMGADHFDCVFPARTARFGRAITSRGFVDVLQDDTDCELVDPNCDCECCSNYTKNGLIALNATGQRSAFCRLLTIHNFQFLHNFTNAIRWSVLTGTLEVFVNKFVEHYFTEVPEWFSYACGLADIKLTGE
ncbi:hypothetical protein PCE1_004030 [Barthelona sp. PCE]